MRLCDNDIEFWLKKGWLKIEPRPSLDKINGITVDIRLGSKFRIFKDYSFSHIELRKSSDEIYSFINKVVSKEINLEKNEPFFLHPKKFVLSITLESIKLPHNLVAWLDGRSSLARLGLMIHTTANRIDPGWNGAIVLELYNFGKIPLVLHPGMLIGALSFELLSNPVNRPYKKKET